MVSRRTPTRALEALALAASSRSSALHAWTLAAIAAAVLPAYSPGPARAQQLSVFRLTPTDTPTVFYFHSHAIYCQGIANERLALAATVVVPEHPAHGILSTREGAAPVAHCHGQLGYATIVTYAPQRGYQGFDNFQLRVLYDLKSHIVSRTLNVRVQIGGHGNPG